MRERDCVFLAPDEAQSQIKDNPFHLVGNKISFASLDFQTISDLTERQLRHIIVFNSTVIDSA